MMTGQDRDYIMLPNLTESSSSLEGYPQSKTKYIDIVCAGRYHDTYKQWTPANTPILMDYPANTVINLGGYIYGPTTYSESVCTGCNDDGTDYIYYYEEINETLSNQIRYYQWLNDFNLVINNTEKILFGDAIKFNIYFEPTCDLSEYTEWGYSWSATNANPFVIEVEVGSVDAGIGIEAYMYLINATSLVGKEAEDNPNTKIRTYEACFLCAAQFDDFGDVDWIDTESVLADTTAGCNLCEDGITTSTISVTQAGQLFQLTFEITGSSTNTIFELDSQTSNFTVVECEAGYGTTEGAATIDCNECPFNQFTLQQGLDPCIACSDVSEGMFFVVFE